MTDHDHPTRPDAEPGTAVDVIDAAGDEVVAPPKKELGAAGRLAAGVSEKGFGVDPDASEGVEHAWLRLAALLGVLAFVGYVNPWMLVVILAIVLMITLHEFGHYYMAKRAGMKVTEFFLGFGPKIWSTRRGETEYGIKVIPAGAYVKIPGMTNLEEVDPADEPRTYRQKSFGQRIGVAVAGSAMHFLLALGLIFVALVVVGQPAGSMDPNVAASQWRIDEITAGTGADAAGLRSGDQIISIDGEPIGTFKELRSITEPRKGKTVPMVYVRDGERVTTTITLTPFYSWNLATVVPGSGEAKAGLQAGDQILSIDGRSTRPMDDDKLDAALVALNGRSVPVTYRRGESSKVRETTARIDTMVLEGGEGYVGINAKSPPVERLGPIEGVVRTPQEFATIVRLSVGGLGRFFTPSGVTDFAGQVGRARSDRASAQADANPPVADQSSATLVEGGGSAGPSENRLMSIVGLVRFGSDVGGVAPAALISLFALINIFIGVFNLVPLLPFDGGHVVIAVYEKIQEKRLNRRRYFADVSRLLPVVYAVTVVLALLFISTIYLDLANPLKA